MLKKMKLRYILLFILFFHKIIVAQEQIHTINGVKYFYKKPHTFDFILKAPTTFTSFARSMFNEEYTFANILMGTTTALFIIYDQPIYDKVAKWGREWGIGNGDKTQTFLSIAGYPIFRGPTDLGSAMYFIGDGWTHFGLALSFLTVGSINNDNRALQTASQIAQGMVTTALTIQVLKHITGRETPSYATQAAGVWRFFPNQVDYHKKVPKYDAFPSGHLASAMMTLTVIANNYEEYKWIRPVGYSLMTLLSFQMINNGVHWISDYPIALGIGYLFGKIVVDSGRQKVEKNTYGFSNKFHIFPSSGFNKLFKLSIGYSF
jgi:hypothetical protein